MVLKRIYEELKIIENKAKEICQYVEPKERIENGIVVKTFFPNQSTFPTRVSFELDYHDWLKLQKSKEWKDFQKLFLKYQKRHNQVCDTAIIAQEIKKRKEGEKWKV